MAWLPSDAAAAAGSPPGAAWIEEVVRVSVDAMVDGIPGTFKSPIKPWGEDDKLRRKHKDANSPFVPMDPASRIRLHVVNTIRDMNQDLERKITASELPRAVSFELFNIVRCCTLIASTAEDHKGPTFKQRMILSLVGPTAQADTVEDAIKQATQSLLARIGGELDLIKMREYLTSYSSLTEILSNLHEHFGTEVPVLTESELHLTTTEMPHNIPPKREL
ncbi:hypothetical protein Pelo_7515 [Pelomyxa schiedti]|nr:hypothetical protein Pelo_7515 [Pelomyxa schiedti]